MQVANQVAARERRETPRPHRDGVVLALGRRRATFLPQMWETFPDRVEFIEALKDKAGLPGGEWHPDTRLLRYTVTKITDQL